jgi:predicted hydrocarbon binding protein
MKGIIFTSFQDMVEEEIGLECWETIIKNPAVTSGGMYTSVNTYADEELLALIAGLSNYTNVPIDTLIEKFGEKLFPKLADSLPKNLVEYDDLWSFLAAVGDEIHVEVKKLNPDAPTPSIKVLSRAKNTMTLSYKSPRKMCVLALGLIRNAGEYYNTPVTVTHGQCMHTGHEYCELKVMTKEAESD